MNTHTNASYLAKWDPDSPISRIQRDQVAFLAEVGPRAGGRCLCGHLRRFQLPARDEDV